MEDKAALGMDGEREYGWTTKGDSSFSCGFRLPLSAFFWGPLSEDASDNFLLFWGFFLTPGLQS